MPTLVIHQEKIGDQAAFLALCPFGALERSGEEISVNAGCKMCGLCVRKGPKGAAELVEGAVRPLVNKAEWRGVLVYADSTLAGLEPVTLEMLGKARELADVLGEPVYAVLLGVGLEAQCDELLHHGADQVLWYEQEALRDFRLDLYAEVLADAARYKKPGTILVGATAIGRQLAPRVAAKLRTGLTADCTVLQMQPNSDLVQIRPAFGGNIMAQIVTPNHRPQMATVRPKMMDAPARLMAAAGTVEKREWSATRFQSGCTVLQRQHKPSAERIEDAPVLVVAGRGIQKQADLAMLAELAELLGGQLACTRPLVECGWMDARCQVGLSGRTVRPKLLIACGVSGAIQFVAGMNHSETIIAINKDETATIFKTAHYGFVGDLYEMVPELIRQIKQRGKAQ
ncbi:MAG: electron transfer flavoprotein subunit alpha/FixB family protein [Clostridia bacterium]